MVAVGPLPRKQDLIAAIISTKEYAPSQLSVGKRVRPSVEGCHSMGPSERFSNGLCLSSEVTESLGPAAEPSSSMASVALDSAAPHANLKQMLRMHWPE